MTQDQLEALFNQIRALPPEKQEELAEMVEWLATADEDFFEVPDEAWPGIKRGLADADAGRFASDEEVTAAFTKFRIKQGKD